MFKSIKRTITKRVNHKRNQERLFATIITTRKAKKALANHTNRIVEETKTTWQDAMSANI